MSDRFQPISMEQLCQWIFTELEQNNSIFGIPRDLFYVPKEDDRLRVSKYGTLMESPFGPAAGPHSQMAQNIIVAWLCGARFMELKTVQTIDELDVSKPCIDMEDEGYNVEWSQELKVFQSFDEYLRAWILIHALHRKLGFPGDAPGMIFNMSVGYNLEGILKPNVQWFFEVMKDSSEYKGRYVDIAAAYYPDIREMDIPGQLSDSITLSTMHGCPPDEIEKICVYLMNERNIHTSVKLNPTLVGPERARKILHDDLGFVDVPVPDAAFEHDLKYQDAVPMIHNLRRLAREKGLTFGVKLTNTFEVENFRTVFAEHEKMMYMSGRPLHAITVNLAHILAEEFKGDLLMSFSAGADTFNVADLLRSGMKSITVCSDLLKSGGYMRLLQYFESVDRAMDELGASDLADYTCKSAMKQRGFTDFAPVLCYSALTDMQMPMERETCDSLAAHLQTASTYGRVVDHVREWAEAKGVIPEHLDTLVDEVVKVCTRINLRQYAVDTRHARVLKKGTFFTSKSKTPRKLDLFDCIEAPCVDECPVNQKVPQYMEAVRTGKFDEAVALARDDNPIAAILGRVCDHLCENTCIRTHYDEPLAIREMKRFIMSHEAKPHMKKQAPSNGIKVAIIGAGPAGMAAAEKLAYAGFAVTIYEMHPYAGGMVGGTIPVYRLPKEQIDQDLKVLEDLGVEIKYYVKAGQDVFLSALRKEGFKYTVIAAGAQLGKRLGLEGEDCEGVMDAMYFLRNAREGHPVKIGERVGVIGAGDTAMDCSRTAWRTSDSRVSIVYRRSIDQMPADREEIRGVLEEGIEIVEMSKPHRLHVEDGQLRGLVCTRMEFRGDRDAGGRKIPYEVPNSEFEIPLDTMILAISQNAILDFFDEEQIDVNKWGYIDVDPITFETSVEGVFAGGDVVNDGPSSIVKGAADGKAIANAIIHRDQEANGSAGEHPDVDTVDLIRRRARRAWRTPVPHTSIEDRKNFNEIVLTYSEEQAKEEADRCLDCHKMCSICVGVCPNLAIMTYEMEPFTADLPALKVRGGKVETGPASSYRVDQQFQIAVLTDFCNECGNCETFCPTAGAPYKDKPRLYLNREEFEEQTENAFMIFKDNGTWSMDGRWAGETHRIDLNGELKYTSPKVEVTIDPADFSVQSASAGAGESGEIAMRECANMYVLLKGLIGSMPQLPVATREETGTKVGHPGYEE